MPSLWSQVLNPALGLSMSSPVAASAQRINDGPNHWSHIQVVCVYMHPLRMSMLHALLQTSNKNEPHISIFLNKKINILDN